MKDEELQEIADMYGLYTKIDVENDTALLKKQIKELEDVNKELFKALSNHDRDILLTNKKIVELKQCVKTAYTKGMRHLAKALKKYDRTEGAWTDYFEHTVDLVLKRELEKEQK